MTTEKWGVWWAIAGAGWITALPEHHGQLTLFELTGDPLFKCHTHLPLWSVSWAGHPPLIFTEQVAKALASEWSFSGRGKYEARLIEPVLLYANQHAKPGMTVRKSFESFQFDQEIHRWD
jgi:hypothetical protein